MMLLNYIVKKDIQSFWQNTERIKGMSKVLLGMN